MEQLLHRPRCCTQRWAVIEPEGAEEFRNGIEGW